MIISIQGSMAVGKTTLLANLQKKFPDAVFGYEDVTPVIGDIQRKHLDKTIFEDYLAIQKLWIAHEVQRYQKVKDYPLVFMDFGAEEIDFYTRFYPQAIGQEWHVLSSLKNELTQLSYCLPDYIIFLEARNETLRKRKASDNTRTRNFFDFQLEKLLPLKRKWFTKQRNVIFLETDNLSNEEVAQQAAQLISQMVKKGTNPKKPQQRF